MMLEAVERRSNVTKAPHALEHLSDNGLDNTAMGHEVVRRGAQPDALLHAGV